MKTLANSVVIVTGASGGISCACVEAFLDAGARVMMSDVADAGPPVRFSSDCCRFHRADLRDEAAVQQLIRETVVAFGRLDVPVNNAAVLVPAAPVHETSRQEFDQLIAVNVRGPFLCCKHAYPHLKSSRGCILNVSSMAGVHGEKHHAAYAATKGAINALTMSMAVDYGAEGIRCNAVCPSSVLTPSVDKMIEALPNAAQIVELRKAINPLGCTATPDQVAAAVVFLASPAASFITGAIIPVSGGAECGYGVKY